MVNIQDLIKRAPTPTAAAGAISTKPRRSLFIRGLEQVSRTGFAGTAALEAAIKGRPVLRAAKRGFQLKRKVTGSDILRKQFKVKSKVGRFVGGLAIDIVTDPLSFAGIGALTKVGRVAKLGGKTLKGKAIKEIGETLGEQAKRGQRSLLGVNIPFIEGTTPLIKGTGIFKLIDKSADIFKSTKLGKKVIDTARAFSRDIRPVGSLLNKSEFIAARNIFKQAEAKGDLIKQNMVAFGTQLNKSVIQVVGKKNADQAFLDIIDAVELGDASKLNQKLMPVFNDVTEFIGDIEKKRVNLGKEVLKDTRINYFPQIKKPIEDVALADPTKTGKQIIADVRKFTTQTGRSKQRQVLKLTDQANPGDFVITIPERQGFKLVPGTKNIYQKDGKQFQGVLPTVKEKLDSGFEVEANLGAVLAKAGVDVGREQTGRETFDVLSGLYGTRVIPGQALPKGLRESAHAPFKGMAFPKEVAEEIDATYKKLLNDEFLSGVFSTYNKALNGIKGMLTFANPAFHGRNMFSNVLLNSMGDVNPKFYGPASSMLGKAASGIKMTVKEQKLWDEFVESGVKGGGWIGSDILKTVSEQVKGKYSFNPFSRNFPLQKAGSVVGEFVENHARLAHFLDRRVGKGFDLTSSVNSVNKYLFDYQDITDTERVLKQFLPFYTWMRKSTPLLISTAVNKPGKILSMQKAAQNLTATLADGEVPSGEMPEWLSEAFPVFIGKNPDGTDRFVKFEGFFPQAELGKIPEFFTGQTLVEQLSPIIKLPIELGTNYDFFRRQPIEEFEGQPGFRIPQITARQEKVAGLIRPITEINRAFVDQPDLSPKERLAILLAGIKVTDVDPAKEAAARKRRESFEKGARKRSERTVEGRKELQRGALERLVNVIK